MSQFDFPRINFHGRAFINPATGNNGFYEPLVYYDPVQAKALLPPRLYLFEKYLLPGRHLEKALQEVPSGVEIRKDSDGSQYIEIKPIQNKHQFKAWATTPLGSHPLDAEFHRIYGYFRGEKSKKPLLGTYPGYWNFFGDMTYGFQGVSVHQVEVFDPESGKQVYHLKTQSVPEDIRTFLGARLQMEDKQGHHRSVMIDVCPTMALYTQVFCDFLTLEKEDISFFRGKPTKGSLRNLNFNRVVNVPTMEGASGSFFSAIPLDDLDLAQESPVIRFFRNYGADASLIKGIFIRYNVFEVSEDQVFDYQKNGHRSNPARATILGSITPWFDGELASITMGRQLVGQSDFLPGRSLGSMVCRVDADKQLLSIDAIGSIPLERKRAADGSGTTYELGVLKVLLEAPSGHRRLLGSIAVTPQHFLRKQYIQSAGMIDLSLSDLEDLQPDMFQKGTILIEGESRAPAGAPGRREILMRETPYMIASDQPGLYMDAGADPAEGYRSCSARKEPCQLRIFLKGYPVASGIQLQTVRYSLTASGVRMDLVNLFAATGGFAYDGQELLFPEREAGNVIYFFAPSIHIRAIEALQREIVRTDSFINLRVLPPVVHEKPNGQPAEPTVDFNELYQSVFALYDLIYPVSADISPFNEDDMIAAIPILKQLMHPDNWSSPTYMPSTRELSSDQYDLFLRWADQTAAGAKKTD